MVLARNARPNGDNECYRRSMPEVELASGAFKEGELIPKKHTCEGDDLSPPLRWNHPPAGTRSFALIADDPDAPSSARIAARPKPQSFCVASKISNMTTN